MEERKKIVNAALDSFLSMPRKCQEVYFEYLDIRDILPDNILGNNADIDFLKSPIEKIFLFAFSIATKNDFGSEFYLEPQYELKYESKKYFADFVFDSEYNTDMYLFEKPLKLAIECDGHDYHTTKEQVIHDNEKDMAFKMSGFEVLHFSGSQIYNKPFQCVHDTIQFIKKKCGKITDDGDVSKYLRGEKI